MYNLGAGIPIDVKTSAAWLRRTVEQGVPKALYDLGIRNLRGEGMPHDNIEAYKCFYLAATRHRNAAD